MNSDNAVHVATSAMYMALKLSAPFLLAGLIVGLVVSVFQAVTSIQEQSLAFIPKILVTGAVIALGGPWMIDQMVGYTQDLYSGIPAMVGK